jgi:ribonucleotide reductase beta subunit family protein with ferritin-like domain
MAEIRKEVEYINTNNDNQRKEVVNIQKNSIKDEIREYILNVKDENLKVYNKYANDITLISKNNMITYVKDINYIINDTITHVVNMLIKDKDIV